MISKSCEYAIKAVIYVAYKSKKDERVGVKDIAIAIDSPVAFTGKIMQQLSKNELIKSTKGPFGGFWMEDEMRATANLMDIVNIIDGDKLYFGCCLGLKQCTDTSPCPLHFQYKKIKSSLIRMHTETTLEDIANRLEKDATLV